MMRFATCVLAVAALSGVAFAQPAKMTDPQLDSVVAGWNPGGNLCGSSAWDCGNNGWGNGWDPTNPGSDSGLTAPSKDANGTVLGTGQMNVNPTPYPPPNTLENGIGR